VTPKRGSSPSKAKDDRSAALAVLASVGVTVNDPEVTQLASLLACAQAAADEDAKGEIAKVRDRAKMVKALAGVKLVTESGRQLREALLRDLRGEVWPTIAQMKRGWKPPPILTTTAAKRRKGRPVDVAVERTIRDFEAVLGWNWEVCAAAAFLAFGEERIRRAIEDKAEASKLPPPAFDRRSYEAIKKSFRDWDRRHRRSGKGKA
jgi:hypothetical protein